MAPSLIRCEKILRVSLSTHTTAIQRTKILLAHTHTDNFCVCPSINGHPMMNIFLFLHRQNSFPSFFFFFSTFFFFLLVPKQQLCAIRPWRWQMTTSFSSPPPFLQLLPFKTRISSRSSFFFFFFFLHNPREKEGKKKKMFSMQLFRVFRLLLMCMRNPLDSH